MPQHKRARADSISAAIRAMEASSAPEPTVPAQCELRPEDLPFWSGIIASRAREEWSANDLVVAAHLARTQADIETEQRLLYDEGSIIINARGTQIMNPRATLLEMLSRRQGALMRSLRMAGAAAGSARDDAASRALERNARNLREAILAEDPDGLLAS